MSSYHHWITPTASLICVLAVLLAFSAPVPVGSPPCPTTKNSRSETYQFRQQMDRCEGLIVSRPITATGLWLASYTIGQPQSQQRRSRGEVFSLKVPATSADQGEPSVTVREPSGGYKMKPLILGRPLQGWRDFFWGAEVLKQEGINPNHLRAIALISPTGNSDIWLPVKFTSARAYSLIIGSNGTQHIVSVRIFSSDKRLVHKCSGPTRLESELVCLWNGRDTEGRISPAGRYILVARPTEGGASALNVSLRHDPRWLLP